jgi:HAD superfamily hydrolase (TIGR01549 family)
MKAIIFDLDGTLVDTVHAHVLAWQDAFCEFGLSVDAASIHRRIGMSSKLLMEQCARELGATPSSDEMAGIEASHTSLFDQLAPTPRALNGAKQLLTFINTAGIQCGIATSGKRPAVDSSLACLDLARGVVVIDGSDTQQAKPAPDIFIECQRRLGIPVSACFVVGDAIWDILAARRGGFLAIGLLCGGASEDELYRAGAFRVYDGLAQLQMALAELGF